MSFLLDDTLDLSDGQDPWNIHSIDKLFNTISGAQMSDDGCQYQFRAQADQHNLLGDEFMIRQLEDADQIIFVQVRFIGDDGNCILDGSGNPISYKSNRRELGHLLEILHLDLVYSSVQYLLQLRPHSNFDLHSLLFCSKRQPWKKRE